MYVSSPITNNLLYKAKYRIDSARAQWWDYTNPGWYFITICTKHRDQWFGKIIDGKPQLSNVGNIINQCWHNIPHWYPNVSVDEFVVMPDHIHGIVIINGDNNRVKTPQTNSKDVTNSALNNRGGVCLDVHKNKKFVTSLHTGTHLSVINLIGQHTLQPRKIEWQPNSLGSIVRAFKAASTKRIRQRFYNDFAWLPRYHDWIIRDEKMLAKTRKYIISNPYRWPNEKNDPLAPFIDQS